MKVFKSLFIGTIICLSIISCTKDTTSVEVTGIIQKQGMTIYQYGTHTIAGYAIRSSSVILDNYVDQSVTVVGHKVEGYPVDGGPEFIDVEKIK